MTAGISRARRRHDAGLSLVETLVVICILSLILAVSIPRFTTSQTTDLRTLALRLAAELRAARARAVATGQLATVRFEPASRAFWFEPGGRKQALPSDLDVQVTASRSAGEARLIFFADGSSSGGTISLAKGPRRSVIGVDWLTGVVRVEPSS